MEYRFTFIDKDGKEETTVTRGNNFMDALWEFYEFEGICNIIKVERIN